MSQTAFRSHHIDVMKAYDQYMIDAEMNRLRRVQLTDSIGRKAYVNRGDGYGSTRIVGFERFDSDKTGDLIHHDGCLIVSSPNGQHNGLVVPNLRRKSGRAFAEELKTYTNPPLVLPGMGLFHVWGIGGAMYAGGPTIHEWTDDSPVDRSLYVLWECETPPVSETEGGWASIPLSIYHAVREANADEETEDAPAND